MEMGRKQIVEDRSKQERQERRQHLGALKSLVIRPATITRYERALQAFLHFVESQSSDIATTRQALDVQLQDYLDWLWEEGESLSLAGDTLSAVQHFQPSCRRNLCGSWRLLKARQLHELPARAPPLTWDLLTILLGWFQPRAPEIALGLPLAFRALLRTDEL